MGTAILPHAGLPQIGCPRSGLFAGQHPEQQELSAQRSQKPEKVLNIRQNAPAKPLCKGREAAFLCIACPAALLCRTEINFPHEGFPRPGEAVTAGD